MLKLKSYEDFFKDVEAEGEFKCFDYSDEVKKEIIDDYRKVFAYPKSRVRRPLLRRARCGSVGRRRLGCRFEYAETFEKQFVAFD